ncbi:TrkA C-terminal domain-containing protein [Flavonifractor plautii]|uniref:TrkA C-terminal domain-containing protein n=1 Tax=Flavonifractor plautii TaxID=292800 RepID=UPI003EEF1642
MVDSAESVSRTFNDYQDQRQLHLTRFPIGAGHPWVGRTIGECELPADALVVMLRRGSENVIPNGDTAIQAGNLWCSARRSMRTMTGSACGRCLWRSTGTGLGGHQGTGYPGGGTHRPGAPCRRHHCSAQGRDGSSAGGYAGGQRVGGNLT